MLPTLFMMIMIRRTFLHRAEAMAIRVALLSAFPPQYCIRCLYYCLDIQRGCKHFYGAEINRNSYITKEGLKYILEKTQKAANFKNGKEMVSRVLIFPS